MNTKEKALEMLKHGVKRKAIITYMANNNYKTIQGSPVSGNYLNQLAWENGLSKKRGSINVKAAADGATDNSILLLKATFKSRLSEKTKIQIARELLG